MIPPSAPNWILNRLLASPHQQLKAQPGNNQGVYLRSTPSTGLAEEAGAAYKNVDDVIEAAELAGISKRVVRFTPIGNIKG